MSVKTPDSSRHVSRTPAQHQGGRAAPLSYDAGSLAELQLQAETSPAVQRLSTLQRAAAGTARPPAKPGISDDSLLTGRTVQRKPPDDPDVFRYTDGDGHVWSRDLETDEWCHPADSGKIFWDDTFYKAFMDIKSKAGARFTLSFVEYTEVQLAKAEKEELAKIPVDLSNSAEVGALYGSSTVIDPVERVAAIKKLFTDAGYECSATDISTTSSSSTPPHLFDVIGHPAIFKFEVHPGGGIHTASYIRISTNKGMIKVINSNSNPAYDKLNEKAKYVTVSI
ncbi:hypothetical protein [uncultured Roseobacter sp.]|uniref:hypothetical protein n=1 Tax=uncultured Roseobacter sp. TaxID=114847 RepID=UPI00260D52BB|nr:hypothetical protein [uncultured Roseobacter sp.]